MDGMEKWECKVAQAFVKAKREFAPALKTSLNPHFKSKYADLSACIEAVDEAFLNNGIAMFQETSADENGVTVETVLLHESGQTLRGGKLHVPAPKHDPQGYGSALSYARRYSLMATCGIAAEDDDANQAASSLSKPFKPAPKPAAPMPTEPQTGASDAPPVMGAPTFPFDPHKGKPLCDASITLDELQDLKWYMEKNVNDPKKAKFKEKNEEMVLALEAEITQRMGE